MRSLTAFWATVLLADVAGGGHAVGKVSLLDPERLHRAVPNTLEWRESGDGLSLAGDTDASGRYQMRSVEIPLRQDTVVVVLELAGAISRGGLYLALLDASGQFLDPVLRLREGVVNGRYLVPTLGGSSVQVVLGNSRTGDTSSWRLSSFKFEQLSFDPSNDLRFRAVDVGALPFGLRKPVSNSLVLTSTPQGVLLTGETDSTQRYQLAGLPLAVEKDTRLVRVKVEGHVLQGRVYYGLLDDRGQFMEAMRRVPQGPMPTHPLLLKPHGTREVSWVLGNAARGRTSELALSAVRVELLTAADRAQAIQEYAGSLGFRGSAWQWAWRTLFPGRNKGGSG